MEYVPGRTVKAFLLQLYYTYDPISCISLGLNTLYIIRDRLQLHLLEILFGLFLRLQ